MPSGRREQEKQRKEQAIANTTGIRILAAISAAVPVRLMKRDLLFVVERLAALLDENRLADRRPTARHQEGQRQRLHREAVCRLSASCRRKCAGQCVGGNHHPLLPPHAERNAGAPRRCSRVQSGHRAIALKVKQEFAAKEKAKKAAKPAAKVAKKAA